MTGTLYDQIDYFWTAFILPFLFAIFAWFPGSLWIPPSLPLSSPLTPPHPPPIHSNLNHSPPSKKSVVPTLSVLVGAGGFLECNAIVRVVLYGFREYI